MDVGNPDVGIFCSYEAGMFFAMLYQWISGVAAGAGAAAGWKVNQQVKIMQYLKISGILRAVQWYYSKIISVILKWGGGEVSEAPKFINCKISESVFLSSYAQKMILAIMRSQNQVKVTKGHQVQIFKKCIVELLCTEKAFWAS